MRAAVPILLLTFSLFPLRHAQAGNGTPKANGPRLLVLTSEGVLKSDPAGTITGDRVKVPHLTHYANPKFPQHDKKEITCMFSGVVNLQGRFEDLSPTECADPNYVQSGEDALKKYTFDPALLDGKPTPMQIKVQIDFKIW